MELFLCPAGDLQIGLREGTGHECECQAFTHHPKHIFFFTQFRCLFLNPKMEVLPQMTTSPCIPIRKQLTISVLLFAPFSGREKSQVSGG